MFDAVLLIGLLSVLVVYLYKPKDRINGTEELTPAITAHMVGSLVCGSMGIVTGSIPAVLVVMVHYALIVVGKGRNLTWGKLFRVTICYAIVVSIASWLSNLSPQWPVHLAAWGLCATVAIASLADGLKKRF